MADKAGTVASSFAGRVVRLNGEDIIDELQSYVTRFQQDVLQRARFVVAARTGSVTAAETERLLQSLPT